MAISDKQVPIKEKVFLFCIMLVISKWQKAKKLMILLCIEIAWGKSKSILFCFVYCCSKYVSLLQLVFVLSFDGKDDGCFLYLTSNKVA